MVKMSDNNAMIAVPAIAPLDPAPDAETDARAVTAVLLTEDGRFLLQLRDDIPGILLPGHWACFGGHVDPGESREDALRRELWEELRFTVGETQWFFESVYSLPRSFRRRVRVTWFVVPLALADIPHLDQQEGSDMALFTLEQALALPKISPLDLNVMIMLARHAELFPI